MKIIRSESSKIIPTPRGTSSRPPTLVVSSHTHSRYSVNDAMSPVDAIVAKVAAMGQPALGIQDHGNMAASVELYQACMKHGVTPFPGSELYFVPDTTEYRTIRNSKREGREKSQMFHLGVSAYTTEGYENLVNLSTLSHRNHH